MKPIAAALALILVAFPSQDNWLQNGDFAEGITHWRGGGRSPADFANDNPFAPVDPLTSKGMIIALKHTQWIKVEQDFRGRHQHGILTVSYKVSPDFKFSEKPDDYVNMPHQIGYDAFRPFNTEPGTWVAFLNDFGSAHGEYYEAKPKVGSSEVQTFHIAMDGLTPLEEKTIALAFPPGEGKLIILSVSLQDTESSNP